MEPAQQQIEEISPSGFKRQLNKSGGQSPGKYSESPNKQMQQQNEYGQDGSASRIENPFIDQNLDNVS